MVSISVNIITGLIAFVFIAIFTIGLAKSIASGFSGFKGALPFIIIVGFVLLLALYDLYATTIRKSMNSNLAKASQHRE